MHSVVVDIIGRSLARAIIANRTHAKEGPLHAAADVHSPKLTVAFRLAFARARQVIRKDPKNVNGAIAALKSALKSTLPPLLLKVVASGGDVAARELVKKLRAAGEGAGHEFHGNQWAEGGSSVEVHSVGSVQTYHLSKEVTNLRNDDKFVWETDLLPSLDGLRPAGISETENAKTPGAAKRLNALATQHGVKEGFAIEIRDKERLVGLATVARSKTGAADYPDFLKAASDYMGGRGLSTRQEKTLGKWLGFTKKSTDQYLNKKGSWNKDRALAGPVKFEFDHASEQAISWADKHAAELIDGISETTRDAINEAIAGALEGDGIDAAINDIADAIGDVDRAERIAHHEVMMAASEGQRQAWDQAVDDGLLTGDEQRTWITVGDDKVCPICDDLDGQVAPLDGSYISEGDEYDGPPAHVGCRCTEGIQG